MKVSELLFSFILAALTVLGINYFFFNKQSQESQSVRRGQDFEAPLSEIHAKPLNLEVDFDEDQKPIDEVITKVQTKWGSLEFTNHGAVVKDLGFNHVMGDKQGQIFTIRPLEVVERSTLAFLVALNKRINLR